MFWFQPILFIHLTRAALSAYATSFPIPMRMRTEGTLRPPGAEEEAAGSHSAGLHRLSRQWISSFRVAREAT